MAARRRIDPAEGARAVRDWVAGVDRGGAPASPAERAARRRTMATAVRFTLEELAVFDCDYYWWKDGKSDVEYEFEGEFLQEYSWGEYILAGMMKDMDKEW